MRGKHWALVVLLAVAMLLPGNVSAAGSVNEERESSVSQQPEHRTVTEVLARMGLDAAERRPSASYIAEQDPPEEAKKSDDKKDKKKKEKPEKVLTDEQVAEQAEKAKAEKEKAEEREANRKKKAENQAAKLAARKDKGVRPYFRKWTTWSSWALTAYFMNDWQSATSDLSDVREAFRVGDASAAELDNAIRERDDARTLGLLSAPLIPGGAIRHHVKLGRYGPREKSDEDESSKDDKATPTDSGASSGAAGQMISFGPQFTPEGTGLAVTLRF